MTTIDDNMSTNDDSYRTSGSKGSSRFGEASPEEIKERVKQTVKKGVAAVAGAVEGLADEMEQDDVAGNTKRAIQDVGDTTKAVAQTTKEQFRNLKESVKGDSKGLGSTSDEGSMGPGTQL